MIKCTALLEEENKNLGDLMFYTDADIERLKIERKKLDEKRRGIDESNDLGDRIQYNISD
jgi:hypothetical protein